ncbi:MAG: polyprenyl diphosphate synthase [Rickettsiaceae bacterium]|nr:polyprenyl diphosphate synthase [Rickettsiaceae bacterium]
MNKALKHIAIIMDGNNRWAKSNNLSTEEGHEEGARNAFRIIQSAIKLNIQHCSLYVFSSENLQRPKHEVDNIIKLINYYVTNEINKTLEIGVKLRFIGDLSYLDTSTIENLSYAEKICGNNNKICVNIMLCYGSRSEIVYACKKIIDSGIKQQDLDEEIFASNLYDRIPDVDLLIRTGDKMRISNFLLWQSAYAELFFSKKMWPEFNEQDLKEAIVEYNSRSRTFGKR